MSARVPHSVWDIGATLGEGPVWVQRDAALWFTDIKRRKIHRFDADKGVGRSWDAPRQIGFVHPAATGGFVVGLQGGLYRFDERDGGFALIAEVEPDMPRNRINDGVVDPSGRLWFGTMDDAERAANGRFYCFDGESVRDTGIGPISITNGPAVSPDGRVLYFVDTTGRTIRACDISGNGAVGAARDFVRIEPGAGNPDGPTVDSEGCVWVGLYGGSAARRYAPDGTLVETVRFPVANITKLAFGGADLRTVFATTARHLLKPDALAAQPQAGDLFAFRADVPGVPAPLVRC